jgi:hypothetical protein
LEEVFNKVFLEKLNPFLIALLSEDLTHRQKMYLKNMSKYTLEQKVMYAKIIKGDLHAKAKRERKREEQIRRNNNEGFETTEDILPV